MSPHLDAVRVERVWVAGGVVRIRACTREVTVACPDCGRGSARVHSRYGRTLADVAVGLPIELWAGRDAEQLAAWLRTLPGVKVGCRDGSLVYRQGIADGAPNAVQVSDRFHLWQGLSKRIVDIAAAHRGCLPAAVPEPEPAPPPATPAEPSDQADTPARRHGPPPREAPVRGGARGDRHRTLAQRRSPRAGPEPAHRGQIRPGRHLAGLRSAHPDTPSHQP
jgi:hypothetical protein